MKKKATPAAAPIAPSPVQQQASQNSTADMEARNQQLAQVNNQVGAANSTIDEAKKSIDANVQPTVDRFTQRDATGSTPLRRALTNTMTGSTANAYDNARAANLQRAQASGFGLQQPITQGADRELEARRAHDIGQIPGQVEQQVAPLELQAAGLGLQGSSLRNSLASTQLGGANAELGVAGQYTPGAYLNTAGNLEQQNANRQQQEEQFKQQQKGGLWKGLAKVGLGIAGNFIPGASAAGKIIGGVSKGF